MIAAILRIWSKIETILIGLLIFAALVCFLGGAVIRALAPLHAVDWAEEVSLYFIVWATVISGSAIVADGRHISTEVFVSMLPLRARNAVAWAMTLLAVGFCGAMLVYGWQAHRFALMLDERSASTLRAQQGYALFLALPVGMALILGRVGLLLLAGERAFAAAGGPVPKPET